MLKNFRVYPKNGEMLLLEWRNFEFNENSFTLYDSGNFPSKEGFLSFDNVAAILPEEQSRPRPEAITFRVYLKNRKEPLEIAAHALDAEQPPSVKFYWQLQSGGGEIENTEIPEIYVALSEVVAIIPSDGLVDRWR